MDQAIAPGADRVGDWMITYSGKRFWPLDPRREDISFSDIGHALSMICRYGGHVRRFYSVAEHSVLLALYFEKIGRSDLARYALLHDGSEAYVGDIIRPLKYELPQYRPIEKRIERLTFEAAGLSPECPQEVKEADSRIIVDEATELFRPEVLRAADWVFRHEALKIAIVGCEPHQAERLFAAVFLRLFPAVAYQ